MPAAVSSMSRAWARVPLVNAADGTEVWSSDVRGPVASALGVGDVDHDSPGLLDVEQTEE